MKKILLFPIVFLSLILIPHMPQVHAEETQDCYLHADVPITTGLTMKSLGSVNLRSGPCMEGTTILGTLALDEMVTAIATNDGWYKVKRQNGTEGWVWNTFLQDPSLVKPAPTTETPSTTTELKPQECYLHKDVPTVQTLRVTEALNLRDGACLEGTKVLTTLPQNSLVETIAVNGSWYKIKYNGFEGWAWGAYLSPNLSLTTPSTTTPSTPPTTTPSTTTPPVTPPSTSTSVFSDTQGHLYQKYIDALYPNIITGYADKTYKPNININRAEFITILMRALAGGTSNLPTDFNQPCFPDVLKDQFYTTSTCYAKNQGVIAGYPDGLFYPGNNIVAAEAFKMLAQAFQLPQKTLKSNQMWYEAFAQALSDAKAIPPTLKDPSQKITRGEMAAMIYSLLYKEALIDATQFNYFPAESPVLISAPPTPAPVEPSQPAPSVSSTDLQACVDSATVGGNVNYKNLNEKVLSLINTERTKRGLTALKANPVLNASSLAWIQEGQYTTIRPNGLTLDQYEQSLGVKSYALLLENLGSYGFNCQETDCTKTAMVNAEKIHQLFMAEENKTDNEKDRFKAIVSPDVTDFGFGFLVKGESIYMLYQFSKEVVGDADMLCKALK